MSLLPSGRFFEGEKSLRKFELADFSDRGRLFQSDRGIPG